MDDTWSRVLVLPGTKVNDIDILENGNYINSYLSRWLRDVLGLDLDSHWRA
jgi:hypothetical protein